MWLPPKKLSPPHPQLLTTTVTLPRTAADPLCLRQAIALELGDVVYQTLSRRRTPDGHIAVTFRALPTATWRAVSLAPRAQWPLIPDAVASARYHSLRQRARPYLLTVLITLLCLVILQLGLHLGVLIPYSWRLHQMLSVQVPAVSAAATALPQASWISGLNTLRTLLAPGRIVAFHFGPEGHWVRVEGLPASVDARLLVSQAFGGRPVTLTSSGVYTWRD